MAPRCSMWFIKWNVPDWKHRWKPVADNPVNFTSAILSHIKLFVRSGSSVQTVLEHQRKTDSNPGEKTILTKRVDVCEEKGVFGANSPVGTCLSSPALWWSLCSPPGVDWVPWLYCQSCNGAHIEEACSAQKHWFPAENMASRHSLIGIG